MSELLFQLADICRREKERLQHHPSDTESRKLAEIDRNTYLASELNTGSSNLQICLSWLKSKTSNTTEYQHSSIWLAPGLYIFIGLFLGLLTMSGVIAYSGDNPVNIIYWLIIFVIFQWVMMLLTLIFAVMNPGRSGFVAERIQAMLKDSAFRDLPSELMPILFFRINQWIAVSFLTGAAVTFLLAIISQDIAFGWATTLAVKTESVVYLVQLLATPWQSWWLDAVPSAELIHQTLFFRISGTGTSTINPQLFGHWWPFLFACLIFYSLIPRLVLLLGAQWQFYRTIERVCTSNPLLNAVVQRMTQPLVYMTSLSPLQEKAGSVDSFREIPETTWPDLLSRYADSSLLCWRTETPNDSLWNKSSHIIGDGRFTDELIWLKQLNPVETVLWLVPGWESPLAELKDLLAVNNNPQILLLQSLSGASLSEADQMSWSLFVEGQANRVSLLRLNTQDSNDD